MISIALSRRAEVFSLSLVMGALKGFRRMRCALPSPSLCWALMTTCCVTWA